MFDLFVWMLLGDVFDVKVCVDEVKFLKVKLFVYSAMEDPAALANYLNSLFLLTRFCTRFYISLS